jgi:hypothetical protein
VLRLTLLLLAFVLGIGLAFGLVSCGGRDEKGLLAGTTADQIVANLDQVQQDAANGDCASAASAADEVQSEIEQLGSEVNAQLRQHLVDGAAHLQETIARTCEEASTTATIPTVPSTTTTEKTTTKSTTTSTTTEPTSTTTSTTTVPTATTPTVPPTGGTPGGGGVVPPSGTGR